MIFCNEPSITISTLWCRALGAMTSLLTNRGLGIKTKKCLHEGVIAPTALYGANACVMRSAERRKLNVLEMKCLRSWLEWHEWMELGMKRFIGELE